MLGYVVLICSIGHNSQTLFYDAHQRVEGFLPIFVLMGGGVPEQVRYFLWFHVNFTYRRILSETKSIQGPVGLPGEFIFFKTDNKYHKRSYRRIVLNFVLMD